MSLRKISLVFVCLVVVATLAIFSTPLMAQNENKAPVEVFAGYSYYAPGGSFIPIPPTTSGIDVDNMAAGWGAAATWNFSQHWGLTFDTGGHYGGNANAYTLMVGPQLALHGEHWEPFANFLIGMHRFSPEHLHGDNAFGLGFGGGVNYRIGPHWGLRLFEADYIHSDHTGAFRDLGFNINGLNGARVQSGLMFYLGETAPKTPPSASCTVQPNEVFAGEPVTASASTNGFNPKHTLKYDWTSSGGKISGKDTSASVDTTDMQPGSYTVTANVSDPKSKKATASCNASFAIKERPKHPPEVSCSANPATVQGGTPSTVTCNCSTPDSGPEYKPAVTVNISNWTSSAGKVSGTGNTAQLDTTGASAGPITVTATCTDSRGLTGSGNATVNVEVPPPPPQVSKINTCEFPSKTKPARVDNACKAVLDDVALRLQREADAKAVVVGNAEAKERKAKTLAADRAVNTKEYLVKEKGIDASRIEVRSGAGDSRTADVYLVPQGATFNEPNTEPVTEKPAKAPARKKSAKKAPAAPGQ